jgi:RNA polymerase sigma factor (sigma-70 family)
MSSQRGSTGRIGNAMDELPQYLRRVLERSGLQPADRDDAVQETLLRVMHARSRGTAIRDERAFAVRIAMRLAIDGWRRRAHGNGHLEIAAPAEPPATPAEVEALYAAIALLPARPAAVITLRKLCEMDYETIAGVLGISVANCRSHCRYGLSRLRTLIRGAGEATGGDA